MTRLELAYPQRCPIAKALLTHHFGRCRGCVLTTHFHLCYIPVLPLLYHNEGGLSSLIFYRGRYLTRTSLKEIERSSGFEPHLPKCGVEPLLHQQNWVCYRLSLAPLLYLYCITTWVVCQGVFYIFFRAFEGGSVAPTARFTSGVLGLISVVHPVPLSP